MSAYRDDLEAAQLRAEDLEREVAALRERNEKVEAELAGGDTAEQLANARRLARSERHQRLIESLGGPAIASSIVVLAGGVLTVAAFATGDLRAAVAFIILSWGALKRINTRPRCASASRTDKS